MSTLHTSTKSADQTAQLFTRKLLAHEPFVHIRYGDADYDWMMGGSGHTCDQEFPRPGIGEDLGKAWLQLWSRPDFYLGDIETFKTPATDAIRDFAATLLETQDHTRLVHTEALLIHRLTPDLLAFYRTLRAEKRRKVLVGPMRIAAASEMLDARHVLVSATKANEVQALKMTVATVETFDWDILLTCCGRASKLLAGELAVKHPNRTIIELGSGLDPLFVGRTRSEQVSMHEARKYFAEML